MKKLWIGLAVVAILIAAPFVVGKVYDGWGTSYYGQVGEASSRQPSKDNQGTIQGYYYVYHIKGYDKDGKSRMLTVNTMGDKKFTKGHYIKILWTAAKGVKNYEGVKWSAVPQKAQNHLRH